MPRRPECYSHSPGAICGRYRARSAHSSDAQLTMPVSLFRSSSTVGGMTLLSRVLGFLRDVLLAVLFGASAGMDAFLVAFKIPNFMRRLFAEGAFAQSFVPVLSQAHERESLAEVRDLIGVVSGTLMAVLALITAFGVLAAPLWIWVFAPGFADEPAKFQSAADMLRITFPYLFFISLTALAGSVLNTMGRFALPAFAPALLNISLIFCALFLAPRMDQPVMALAIGVLIAGLAQLALQLPTVARLGLLPRPRWGWSDSRVQRILRLMLPILFGSSVAQIALLLDTVLASLLVTGSVSWLYYSDRLMEFPLGVFTIAIATVILPRLSRLHTQEAGAEFGQTVNWALRMVALICVPAALGLFFLAGPLLITLFNYAAFGESDVLMSRWSLMAYAFGLLGFSLVKVLIPAYFARQDTRTPVRYGIIALSVTMLSNLSMVGLALHLEWHAPHALIALGTSLGSFLHAGLLLHGIRAQASFSPDSRWRAFLLRIGLAGATMALTVTLTAGDLELWFELGAGARVTRLFVVMSVAAVTYFGSLWLMGLRGRDLAQPVTN